MSSILDVENGLKLDMLQEKYETKKLNTKKSLLVVEGALWQHYPVVKKFSHVEKNPIEVDGFSKG